MLREPSKPSFGASMVKMMDATQDGHLEAAEALEDLVESGEVPRKHEFSYILYAALGYDIANEPHSARRMYERLAYTEPPNLEHFVLSRANSRLLTDSLARAGLRDSLGLDSNLSRVRDDLNSRKECMKHVDDAYRDDYVVLLATVNLLAETIGALASSDGSALKRANSNAALFYDDLEKFSPDPWISIAAALSAQLIGKIAERAVANLEVPYGTKNALREKQILEVWKTQADAVNGLLGGKSVVCSSPPGTGKSFMAYLAAGNLSGEEQMAYLVPTRSLSAQVFDDLQGIGSGSTVAISTRDETKYDDRLSECGVVVSTYEKMGALVRSGKVDPTRVKRVVADEIHIIGDEARGIAAEMALAGLMEGAPQLVCLSGLLGKDDAKLLSQWLGANPVESSWKSTRINEKILLDGTVYLKDGGEEKIPILARSDAESKAKRMAAAKYYSASAVRESTTTLISVASRRDAFRIAREIAKSVRSPGLDDHGMIQIMGNKMPGYKDVADKIREIEPNIPEFGKRMIEMLESGVAYHHAGLPRRYREVVEEGVKQGKVDVLVATPTLEAGVNMPIKTVVFFEPIVWSDNRPKLMDSRRYKNIAGRAGRAGYHRSGDIVVIATTPEEVKEYGQAFWQSEPEPLQSAFFGATWKAPNPATSAFRSHVLSHVIANPGDGAAEIAGSLRKTWFYRQDRAASMKELESAVKGSVEMLECNGMIRKDPGGQLYPTPEGAKVSESALTPDAAAVILPKLRRLDGGVRKADLLLLACLADDLQGHAHRAGNKAPLDCVKAAAVNLRLGQGPRVSAVVEKAMKCASLLHYWIESRTSSEIAASRGVKSEIGPPVSEDLAADASRVLQSMAILAEFAVGKELAMDMRELADACRAGSRDSDIRYLSELEHGGRDSAIKISRKLSGRHMTEMDRGEIEGLFSDNKGTASALFEEIQGRGAAGMNRSAHRGQD